MPPGALATLLLAGRSSDQAGRKPVLAAALGASALSTVVFILAPDVGALIAARVVSGLSAGLMTGTATATLTELVPASASRRGIAGGHGREHGRPRPRPAHRRAVRPVRTSPHGLGVRGVPGGTGDCGPLPGPRPGNGEPAPPARLPLRRPGSASPSGLGEFVAAGVAAFSAFSLLGLFFALAPTFLGDVLHERSHAVQGAVVFLLMAVGTLTQLLLSRFSSRRVALAWPGLFLAALALIVAALAEAALVLFLAGTVVGGAAVGAVFMGSLATANRLAPPERRGQAISTYFMACYSGLIIPVVGVGVASGFIGDFAAVLAFSILIAALCLFCLASIGVPYCLRAAGRR